MKYDLNRQPLYETVEKHATSKTFLTAIVCNYIYVCASLLFFSLYFIFFFDILNEMDIPIVAFALIIAFAAIVFCGSSVISLIMTSKLLKVRNFFLGKTNDANGLAEYTKTVKLSYLYTIIAAGIPLVISLIAMLFTMTYQGVAEGFIIAFFFVLPIFAAEIAGIVILYYFTFKSIRNTVNYAINATNNIPEGKVSVFLIVLSIISLVGTAMSVFYSGMAALLFGVLKNVFLEEMTFAVAPISSLYNIIYLIPIVTIPTLISSICYVKLIFGFKKDMEFAKKEHAWLQAMRARSSQSNQG